MNSLNKLIKSQVNNNEQLKRIGGVIVSVLEDYSKATVKLNNNINTEVELLNCTGNKLVEGDFVWVHYWGNITSGYIAIKNGKQKPLGTDSLYIENATVMTEGQSPTYANISENINIDVKNKQMVYYGEPKNPIICQGYLCQAYLPTTTFKKLAKPQMIYGGFYLNAYRLKDSTVPSGGLKIETEYTISVTIQCTNYRCSSGYPSGEATYSADIVVSTYPEGEIIDAYSNTVSISNKGKFGHVGFIPILRTIYYDTTNSMHYAILDFYFMTFDKEGNCVSKSELPLRDYGFIFFDGEYDYNMGITSRSEIQPSNFGGD